jgi:acetyl esterase
MQPIHYKIPIVVRNENITVMTTLHKSPHPNGTTILYIHGGGLIYGTRHDLPRHHIHQLLEQGFDLVKMDYPLAPSVSVDELLEALYDSLLWLKGDPVQLKLNKVILFGRSGGSYLALKLCDMIMARHNSSPAALILFYGYHTFEIPSFFEPAPNLGGKRIIHYSQIQQFYTPNIVVDDATMIRALLYYHLRQHGTWMNALGITRENVARYAISEDRLQSFPKAFIAASTSDDDVPYEMSVKLSQLIPESTLFTVHEMPHDFDSQIKSPQTAALFESLSQWFND